VVVGDITTWQEPATRATTAMDTTGSTPIFMWPMDIEFTPDIGVYVSDWNNHRIRRLGDDGFFHTVIGHGNDGDGAKPARYSRIWSRLPRRHAVRAEPSDAGVRAQHWQLVVVCWHNHKLREWDPATGKVKVLVGEASAARAMASSTPRERPLEPAPACDRGPDGSIYINDQRNQCIRRLTRRRVS